MIFAHKLIRLRKKMGLSQEELAYKMNVSRQAISKWESSQSIPDLEKILQLGALFGVSTDFLLKDELDFEEESLPQLAEHIMTIEEIKDYLKHTKKVALKMSIGTILCILSPVVLILLSILSDDSFGLVKTGVAVVVGIVTLFVLVSIAVVLFISTSFSNEKYDEILKNNFSVEYAANNIIKDKKKEFRGKYVTCILVGVILCILSPLALIIGSIMDNLIAVIISFSLLFLMVSIAVFMFVYVGIRYENYNKVLKDGGNKMSKKINKVSRIVWLLATIVYLSVSFTFGYWNLTWIIWVIAAVIQTVIVTIGSEE